MAWSYSQENCPPWNDTSCLRTQNTKISRVSPAVFDIIEIVMTWRMFWHDMTHFGWADFLIKYFEWKNTIFIKLHFHWTQTSMVNLHTFEESPMKNIVLYSICHMSIMMAPKFCWKKNKRWNSSNDSLCYYGNQGTHSKFFKGLLESAGKTSGRPYRLNISQILIGLRWVNQNPCCKITLVNLPKGVPTTRPTKAQINSLGANCTTLSHKGSPYSLAKSLTEESGAPRGRLSLETPVTLPIH